MLFFLTDMFSRYTVKGDRLPNGYYRVLDIVISPDGRRASVDDKRYGGEGMLLMAMCQMHCEMCGGTEKLRIHHNNGFENGIQNLLLLCAKCHGVAHSKLCDGFIPLEVLISPRYRLDVSWDDEWWKEDLHV